MDGVLFVAAVPAGAVMVSASESSWSWSVGDASVVVDRPRVVAPLLHVWPSTEFRAKPGT